MRSSHPPHHGRLHPARANRRNLARGLGEPDESTRRTPARRARWLEARGLPATTSQLFSPASRLIEITRSGESTIKTFPEKRTSLAFGVGPHAAARFAPGRSSLQILVKVSGA